MSSMMLEIRRWQLWFPFLMLVILTVSIYDTWLIVCCRDVIIIMEENPVGRWLLEVNAGQIGLFVRMKIAGTIVVLSVLMIMWIRQHRMLFPVITSVASYQSGLMFYLTVF